MSLEKYVRSKQVQLARDIENRTKICLDLNYWIDLREAAAGENKKESLLRLLHLLREGVAQGTLICPISDSIFLELFKQPFNEERRIGTARLIDELSLGVTIIRSDLRTGTEIYLFLLNSLGISDLYKMEELIWTKLCYVLGEQHPYTPEVSPELQLLLQKEFVNFMWEQPLTEMILAIGDKGPQHLPFIGLGAETNRQRDLYSDEITSFSRAYEIEIGGGLEVAGDTIADIMCDLSKRNNVQPPIPHSLQWQETKRKTSNLLHACFVNGKARKPIRTLHIGAMLHAAMRYDKRRRFRDNDFYDFQHATAALAYCDAFFTDGPLADLISQRHLSFGEINNCRVFSKTEDAVAYLCQTPHSHSIVPGGLLVTS